MAPSAFRDGPVRGLRQLSVGDPRRSGTGDGAVDKPPEARPTRMLPLPGLRLPDDLASNGGRYRCPPARYVGLIRPHLHRRSGRRSHWCGTALVYGSTSKARQYLAVFLARAFQFLGIDPEDVEDGRRDLPGFHIIIDGRRGDRGVRNEQGNVAVVRDEEPAMFR